MSVIPEESESDQLSSFCPVRSAQARIIRALDAALAIEMMHSASLIHDDLLDQGLVRRNLPSAPEKFGPSRALLCGDYLIAKSIEFISPYGEKVVRDFGNAGMDMAEGEVLDLSLIRII